MNNKEKYRNFCKVEKNIPIFSRDWWLDAVCGEDNWDVVSVEKGGQIVASMPYYKIKKIIFDLIIMPKLTQTMGPYIKYPKGQKYYTKLSWEKKMMDSLISQLPKVDFFYQDFHYKITNWLPFYWNGFTQTTRYTYVIENTSLTHLENNFETDIRRRRRKATKLGIFITESDNIEKFYELNKMTYNRHNKQIPYSFKLVENVYKKCKEQQACKIFSAIDKNGDLIAASFLVYDYNTVYYLMGAINSDKKNLGGMDMVLYESIKFALLSGKKFDFEGSMVESIERYFRAFGAIQKPYFSIRKSKNILIKLIYTMYLK